MVLANIANYLEFSGGMSWKMYISGCNKNLRPLQWANTRSVLYQYIYVL